MIRQAAFLLVALAFLLGFCRLGSDPVQAGDKKSPAPITNVSEKKLFDGKVMIKVSEDNGLLDYEVKIAAVKDFIGTFKANEKLKKEEAVWAIWAESSNKVWVLWGPRKGTSYDVNWYEVKEEKGAGKNFSELNLVSRENVLATLPKAMADALPKDTLKKLKGKK